MKFKNSGRKVCISYRWYNFHDYIRTVWWTPDFKEVVKIDGEIIYLKDLYQNKDYTVYTY